MFSGSHEQGIGQKETDGIFSPNCRSLGRKIANRFIVLFIKPSYGGGYYAAPDNSQVPVQAFDLLLGFKSYHLLIGYGRRIASHNEYCFLP